MLLGAATKAANENLALYKELEMIDEADSVQATLVGLAKHRHNLVKQPTNHLGNNVEAV